MAQSQMNLTIGIGVDQGKLDADIRLARAKMNQLSRDANALARQAVKTGAPSDAAEAERASRAATQQAEAYAGLTRQKKAHIAASVENTIAVRKESAAFQELSKFIIEFGKEAGISNLSVRGLKIGLAGLVVAEVIKGFAEATKKMNELSISARDLGTSVGHIKGFQTALRALGDDPNKAVPLIEEMRNRMKGLADQMRDARIEARNTQDVFSETLAAGGTHAEASAAKNKALAEARKKDPLAAYGLSSESYRPGEEARALADVQREGAKMRARGQLDEAAAAQDKLLGKGFDELQAKIPAAIKDAEEATKTAVGIQSAYNQSVAGGVAWWEKMLEAITRAGQAIAVYNLSPQKFQETVGAYPVPGGMASGGYIRGRGTGTSDSILARLSNGEYVVNAASVRRLGVGYLDSLNATRFAAGGLVSAASSSGRPVHLHLGGSSFALSGSSGVVDALVSHAHGQQMRSAGVKPSWFAGRPSGR